MKKVRVFVGTNYGNHVRLFKFIGKCNEIKSDCNLRIGPYRGCDAPHVIDVNYESVENLKKFNTGFSKISTDYFGIEGYEDIIRKEKNE